jgi:hypothetical protein
MSGTDATFIALLLPPGDWDVWSTLEVTSTATPPLTYDGASLALSTGIAPATKELTKATIAGSWTTAVDGVSAFTLITPTATISNAAPPPECQTTVNGVVQVTTETAGTTYTYRVTTRARRMR